MLPIGNDQFREIRENNAYYVDKTLLIKEFINNHDKVSLITRPRRFGKTLNMTMLSEFFDITKDSRKLFEGLAIMNTPYASYRNSRPVIFLSFRNCNGNTPESLKAAIEEIIFQEYRRYALLFDRKVEREHLFYVKFYQLLDALTNNTTTWDSLAYSISHLLHAVNAFYQIPALLLIDEYDQPILSAYEGSYRKELDNFFATFYGSALKGNAALYQGLLTGIQRVAKESIFSKLNNIIVYTVAQPMYGEYFGLTRQETETLLTEYHLTLNEAVRNRYDGYRIGKIEIFNPWSILNYAKQKKLGNYWLNTSTHDLITESIKNADSYFIKNFEQLIEKGTIRVGVNLESSFLELKTTQSLWGLLINSGYLTILDENDTDGLMSIQIPNEEVAAEFRRIVANRIHVNDDDLTNMFEFLREGNIEGFFAIYQQIVLSCTSFYDAKENAYHMLMLGMCITLRKAYKVTSNIESGLGRSDILMESLSKEQMHVIIEFKEGKDLEKLKQTALEQILHQKYYVNLKGTILCIGLAHNKKDCAIAYRMISN